jgi:hypothetical protein
MTYRGHVEGGVVVLEGKRRPPEGTAVRVAPIRKAHRKAKKESLSELLLGFAGKAKGLPRDMARNHDSYLHGQRRRR